jgi:CubicO group peptidase (beta-lactamase class C family)
MLRRVALAIGLAAAPVAAQTATRPDSGGAWVDSIVSHFVGKRSPGCAVGMTRDGALILSRTYGLADVAHAIPIQPDTRFYLASLSKQFTAMSIVLLTQDGTLSLDDPVRKWVPEVPAFGTPITLRELLQHTSGLRDYYTLLAVAGWSSDGELSEKQFLDLVAHQRSLNFKPGTEFLYSNTGYALLAIIVHRASGKPLREFAAERIFRPLGMSHTEFRDDHRLQIENASIGYENVGGRLRVSESNSDVIGDGGMYSTIGDLAKWDANFTSGRVGGQAGVALLQEQGRLDDYEPLQYGFGLALGRLGGLKTVSHSGSYGGFRATYLRFPERNASVITLCNTSTAPATLAEQVALVMLGLVPQKATALTLDLSGHAFAAGATRTSADSVAEARRKAEQLAEVAGRYTSDELEMTVSLTSRDGVLLMQRPKADDIRFVAVTSDLFTNSDQMLLRVERDDRGGVTGFALTITRVRDLEFHRVMK